jgi:hypothetical protein
LLDIKFGNALDAAPLLTGQDRHTAMRIITARHYTASVPSGKSHYFAYETAIVIYAIPANRNLATYLLGYPGEVWELARLWAPDGHPPNLLTRAIKYTVKSLRIIEPGTEALVSYADPNAGHTGGVYKAASWIYHGQSEESRAYYSTDGQVKARRAFHSGRKCLTKREIENLGYQQLLLPGKLRFVRPITHRARKAIAANRKTTTQ